MARNRRNVRRLRIKEYLNMKTFLIIVGILLLIIAICIGINAYKRYDNRRLLAEQKEEIEKQSQEIFSQINDSIAATNQNQM